MNSSRPSAVQRLVAVCAVAVLAVGLGACGGDDDDDDTADSPPETTTEDTSASDTSDTAAQAADADAYVGLEEAAAGEAADAAGVPWRVIERDGEPLAATQDYNAERVNFVVEDGVVVSVTNG